MSQQVINFERVTKEEFHASNGMHANLRAAEASSSANKFRSFRSNRSRAKERKYELFIEKDAKKVICIACKRELLRRPSEVLYLHLQDDCPQFLQRNINLESYKPFGTRYRRKRKLDIITEQHLQNFHSFKIDKVEELIAMFVLSSGAPYQIVENTYFRQLIYYLSCERYKPFSRNTLIKRIMPELAEKVELDINTQIEGTKHLTMSIDVWTTRKNERVYGVMVVFPDGRELLYEALFNNGDRSTSEDLCKKLVPVIKRVKEKGADVTALVTDGAPVMSKMQALVQNDYPTIISVTCIVDSFNLVCKSIFGIEKIANLFRDASRIIQSLTMSSIRTEKLRKLRSDFKLGGKSVASISNTQFANAYMCIKTLCDNEEAINKISSENGSFSPQVLKVIDRRIFWYEIKELTDIIKPLFDAIKEAESSVFRLSDNFYYFIHTASKMRLENSHLGISLGSEISNVLRGFFKKNIDTPITYLAVSLDCRYCGKLSNEVLEKARDYLDTFCNPFVETARIPIILEQFDRFLINKRHLPMDPLEYWRTVNDYDCLRAAALRLFSIVPNSMSCKRAFSTMSWSNSPRRASIKKRNLVTSAKIYMYLRARAKKLANVDGKGISSRQQTTTDIMEDDEKDVEEIDDVEENEDQEEDEDLDELDDLEEIEDFGKIDQSDLQTQAEEVHEENQINDSRKDPNMDGELNIVQELRKLFKESGEMARFLESPSYGETNSQLAWCQYSFSTM